MLIQYRVPYVSSIAITFLGLGISALVYKAFIKGVLLPGWLNFAVGNFKNNA